MCRIYQYLIYHVMTDVLCLSGYPAMGKFLNATGRPILYSCEWAVYARAKGYKVNKAIAFVSLVRNNLQEKISA